MRTLRDTACLLVALASVALAAWQPAVDADAGAAATPAGAIHRVDDRVPQTIDRAILTAPIVRA